MDVYTVQEALELAIATEQLGAELYGRLAKRFSGEKELSKIFERLEHDERSHEACFAELLDDLPEDHEPDDGGHEAHDYLRATAIPELFWRSTFMQMAEAEAPEHVFRNASNLEQNAILMYEAMREAIGPNPVLDEIIETEKNHVVTLMLVQMIVTETEPKGLGDLRS
jgi:rubrerythrin